jgi:hypothetical protein
MKIKETPKGNVQMTISLYEFALIKHILGEMTPKLESKMDLPNSAGDDIFVMYSYMCDFLGDEFGL